MEVSKIFMQENIKTTMTRYFILKKFFSFVFKQP